MANPTDNTNSSQWALLPNDILHQIIRRLHKPCDYVRFGAVCKGWLSSSHKGYCKQKHLLHVYQNFPVLLIPTQGQNRGLYDVTKSMVYEQFHLHLPHKRCCGSSYGWLIFAEKVNKTLELILLNPFLGDSATIKLPPLQFCAEDEVYMMDQYGVRKAILSKDPYVSPHDYEVVALYGGLTKLAHYKSGDKYWSYARKKHSQVLTDVIFYKGFIWAVDKNDDTFLRFTLKHVTQSTNSSPWCLQWNIIGKQQAFGSSSSASNAYLVENSKGELLLARRYCLVEEYEESDDEEEYEEYYDEEEPDDEEKYEEPKLTVNFEVYRLCFSSIRKQSTMKMFRMKTLTEETLFLGVNDSISVPASKYPSLHPNSIYYTNDFTLTYAWNLQFGYADTGIFSVKDGKSGKHFVPSFPTKDMPPPIFVVPGRDTIQKNCLV